MCSFYYSLKSSSSHNLLKKKNKIGMQVTYVPVCRVNLRPALRFKWTSCKSMRKSLLKSCRYHICSPVCVWTHTQCGSSFTVNADFNSLPFPSGNRWLRNWNGPGKNIYVCVVYEYSMGGLEPCPQPSMGNGVQHLQGTAKMCFSAVWVFPGTPLQCGNTEHWDFCLR